MARKKVLSVPQLTSWDEVDQAMEEILIAKGRICEIEVNMNRRIEQIKSVATNAGNPLRDRIDKLELQIRDFVTAHRSELKGKSRKLTFGEAGFRLSTKVHVPPKKQAEVIRLCREYGMDDCVAVKESVLKDVMKRGYSAEEIARTGAELRVTDEFWYDVNEETLK